MPQIKDSQYARLQGEIGSCCGQPLTVEHIIPQARGGSSEDENLWLSCRRCNQYKSAKIEAIDPVINLSVPLFNPRKQMRSEHFAWSDDGCKIIGLTPSGRATVIALKLNNEHIVGARRLWGKCWLASTERIGNRLRFRLYSQKSGSPAKGAAFLAPDHARQVKIIRVSINRRQGRQRIHRLRWSE